MEKGNFRLMEFYEVLSMRKSFKAKMTQHFQVQLISAEFS